MLLIRFYLILVHVCALTQYHVTNDDLNSSTTTAPVIQITSSFSHTLLYLLSLVVLYLPRFVPASCLSFFLSFATSSSVFLYLLWFAPVCFFSFLSFAPPPPSRVVRILPSLYFPLLRAVIHSSAFCICTPISLNLDLEHVRNPDNTRKISSVVAVVV